jgi:predicted acetyltransferase
MRRTAENIIGAFCSILARVFSSANPAWEPEGKGMTGGSNGDFGSAHLQDGDLRLEFVECALHPVHKAPTYRFRMVHADTGEEMGGINLRVGSTPHLHLYAGHIGYTVYPPHRGHRYAARSLRLLVSIAEQLRFTSLWITCDPDNLSSRRSAELAGAEFVEIVDVPEDCIIHRSGHKRKCRYRLDVNRFKT